MGFDLHGLQPNNPYNIQRPVIDWDIIHTEDEKDTYFNNLEAYKQAVKGDYFRMNVWWWRPLWNFVCLHCDDILSEKDIDCGSYNDGHIICKTKAKKVASRLRKMLKNGNVKHYEDDYRQSLEEIPMEECTICSGTGRRAEPPLSGPGELPCNACNEIGEVRSFMCSYPFTEEGLKEFAVFCEESGGFDIC